MKLTEKHREFAVKCFAKFMTRTETTNAFMQEFAHELPPPPPAPKFNRQESNQKHEHVRIRKTANLSTKGSQRCCPTSKHDPKLSKSHYSKQRNQPRTGNN